MLFQVINLCSEMPNILRGLKHLIFLRATLVGSSHSTPQSLVEKDIQVSRT